MRNPWSKKNLFMSMWLSAANSAAGVARGRTSGATKRTVATARSDVLRTVFDQWTSPPKRARRGCRR